MLGRHSAGLAAAIVLSSVVTSLAQQSPTAAPGPADSQKTITVAGCIQTETAVLKRNAAAGDVGMSDEFVLTNAVLNPAAQPTAEPAAPSDPVGTSGSPGNFGKVYRITGDKERELKAQVGQRVEITGTFKNPDDEKAEIAAVGTSGRAPAGELTTANTPEITITSVKTVPGSCAKGGGK